MSYHIYLKRQSVSDDDDVRKRLLRILYTFRKRFYKKVNLLK